MRRLRGWTLHSIFPSLLLLVSCEAITQADFEKPLVEAYVAAYETLRRIDEHSESLSIAQEAPGNPRPHLLEMALLDVRSAVRVEVLDVLPWRDVRFFRAHVTSESPTVSEFVVGVSRTGRVYRLAGFHDNDFALLVGTQDVCNRSGISAIVTLYYQVVEQSVLRPIFTDDEIRQVRTQIRSQVRVDADRDDGHPCPCMPTMTAVGDNVEVAICVFDEKTTRLEYHRVLLQTDGAVEITEKEVVRDRFRADL